MNTTASSVVDPKIDVYGKDGRSGALADLLEFRALKSRPMSKAELTDLIGEMGWTTLPERRILLPGEDEDESPDSLADQAFVLIAQRIDVLEERYPFMLDAGRVKLRDGFDVTASPYVSLLAISIAHAWRIKCAVKPEDVLESVVSSAFTHPRSGSRPWVSAAGMGTAERGGRSFTEALADSASALGLTADPNPRPIHTRARDAGVDTLVGLVWNDGRPGNWVLIGQVTCGMTETWGAKLTQPKTGHWRGYLQELLDPHRFVAVPHHVDDRFMFDMHTAGDGMVVDRLRLALALDDVIAEATPIVDAIMASAA